MKSSRAFICVAAAATIVVACERPPEPPPPPAVVFDTGQVEVRTARDTFRMRVEVASTEEQQGYGLMDRPQLAADAGMLFAYDTQQDSTEAFYMFHTLIPLDIAFMDSAGVVVAIRTMEPCKLIDPSQCNRYTPGAPYHSALEVNRGFLAQRGIELGSRVVRVP